MEEGAEVAPPSTRSVDPKGPVGVGAPAVLAASQTSRGSSPTLATVRRFASRPAVGNEGSPGPASNTHELDRSG